MVTFLPSKQTLRVRIPLLAPKLAWWNRYTRQSQKLLPDGMRVQVSPPIPHERN